MPGSSSRGPGTFRGAGPVRPFRREGRGWNGCARGSPGPRSAAAGRCRRTMRTATSPRPSESSDVRSALGRGGGVGSPERAVGVDLCGLRVDHQHDVPVALVEGRPRRRASPAPAGARFAPPVRCPAPGPSAVWQRTIAHDDPRSSPVLRSVTDGFAPFAFRRGTSPVSSPEVSSDSTGVLTFRRRRFTRTREHRPGLTGSATAPLRFRRATDQGSGGPGSRPHAGGARRRRGRGGDARPAPRAARGARPAHVDRPRRPPRGRAPRVRAARRLPRRQRHADRPRRRPLLRDRVPLDDRLRGHRPGDRGRAAVDDPRDHAAARAVPHRPGRHHRRAAHRALAPGVPHQPLEVPRA